MTVTRHLVDTSLGQMHVRTAGEGGVPLLLLHSQVVAGGLYDRAVPLLATDRLVIVPDRIGYGYSDPLLRPTSFAEHAATTIEALDALGIEEFDVVGFHSGSIEAVELATRHPQRVRRIVAMLLAIFTDEEKTHFGSVYATPPPAPADDGSHLLWYWREWLRHRPPGLDLETIQAWTVDHLRCAPWFSWTFAQAFDYPTAEKVPLVTQPFLVLALHDDLWTQMERVLHVLPLQAQVIDMPQITDGMATTTTEVETVCGHIRRFLERTP